MERFDLIVLGGGPGGYPAAIKAAQAGLSVALIEAKELGGTCLNRGCIPSKSLIADAVLYASSKDGAERGILKGKIGFDYTQMAQRKDEVVSFIRSNLEKLIATNKIAVFQGFGKFISPKEIKVTGKDNTILTADKIIIATGSEPRLLPAFPFDYKKIHDSTSLLALKKAPQSILIVGGGVIGCEFASLFNMLEAEVTILELMPRLIPMEEKTVSEALEKAFKQQGIQVRTSAKVAGIDSTKAGVEARLEGGEVLKAEIALISVGRILNTSNIGLDKAGIATRENGSIPTNHKMETEVPGIYAVGDIASKWWLAHVATHQGIVAASNAAGEPASINYDAVPSVIFSHPEVATVGLSLEDAKARGYPAVLGSFPFFALGRSQATLQTEGFAQIVLDQKTGQILGAQVVGHEASTLVAEMAVAIANELTVESVSETIHAHPTVSEAWMEAAFAGLGMPIHLPPRRKREQ